MLGKIFYNIIIFGTIISICIFPLLIFLNKNKYKYSFKSLYKIFVLMLIILILPINIVDFSRLKKVAKQEIEISESVILHEPEIKFESENTIIEIDDGISVKNNVFFNFTRVVPYIWFGIASIIILNNLVNYLIFIKKQKNHYISDTNINIDIVMDKLCKEMQMKKVEYRISNDVSTPMTIGILNKKIIFPKEILRDNEYEYIIKHELFHIKNKDIEYKFLLLILNSIYWFNPIIYMFTNQVDEILELNCDEYVLQGKEQACRIEYAEILLNQIERNRSKQYKFSMNFANRRKNIVKRFSNIVDKSNKKSIISITTISIVLIAISLILVLCIPSINFATIQDNILENTTNIENSISENKIDNAIKLVAGNSSSQNTNIITENAVNDEKIEENYELIKDSEKNNEEIEVPKLQNKIKDTEIEKQIDFSNTILLKYPFSEENYNKILTGYYNSYNESSSNERPANHTGVDFSVPEGTEIKAAASGTVLFANYKGSYGFLVIIKHNEETITLYAHCSEVCVKEGDIVKQGDIIAKSGKTGNTTGPVLHFELRKNSNPVNPEPYFEK